MEFGRSLEPDRPFDPDCQKCPEDMAPFDVVTSLKVDKDVGMKIVSNVKEVLRDIHANKINYSADKH